MEVPHQIPKIIHYCWFGKTSLPEDAQRCIASWKKFCPDYEIVEWNETKIDLSALPLYVQQAYAAQKWAFVADYVRLHALIRYGGVYMDTDVELVAPLDRFMNQAAFAGFEDASHVATCVMACEPEFPLFKEFLLQYSNMQFLNPDGTLNTTTNVSRLTDICLERGMLQNGQCQSVAGLTIYPADYFCPLALDTGLLKQTENTVAIHWFAGIWWSSEEKYAWKITHRLHRILPVKTAKRLGKAIAIARYRGWSSLAETFSDFCRKQRKHE
jgi:mannosyltransferase OCH1-like enzyme